jgi:hypothetical protein
MTSNRFKQTGRDLYEILIDNHHEIKLDDSTIIDIVVDYIKSNQKKDKTENFVKDSKNIHEAQQDYIYYSDSDILKETIDEMSTFESEFFFLNLAQLPTLFY